MGRVFVSPNCNMLTEGSGLRVQRGGGAGSRLGAGFRVQGLRVQGPGSRVQGSWPRIHVFRVARERGRGGEAVFIHHIARPRKGKRKGGV